MLHRFFCLALALLSMLFASCGMPGVRSLEPGEEIALPGLSVEAPQKSGWMCSHRTEDKDHYVQLFRQGESPTYTHLVMVTVAQLPEEALTEGLPTDEEFLETVKANAREQMPRSRFDPITESFSLDTRFSELCVCTEASAKDRGAVNIGDEPYLVLQAKSYDFVIAKDEWERPMLVHISYTERGKLEEIGPDFDRRAAEFFAAVHLKE